MFSIFFQNIAFRKDENPIFAKNSMKMKKTDKILNWLILVALLAVITVSVFRPEKEKSDENLPSVGLSEVQGLFPEARQVLLLDTSYFAVKNDANETIGSVLLSSPYSDGVKGYAGKIPLLIALDRNGKIMQVKLLDNQETPGFLKRVTDAGYLESWNGLSVDEALQKDVDAISGATYSSMGIQNSLKARLAVLSRRSVTGTTDNRTLWPNVCILVVVALALICFFNPTKTKILRFATLLLSIGILGFWRNASMSLLKFYSWISTGISWPLEWALIVIFALAVLLPLFTGKAFYCTYLCPMGALQELAGKACKKKATLSRTATTILLVIRKLFLLTLLILVAVNAGIDLAFAEPFSVFSVKSITLFSIIFAAIVLTVSLFINRAWCRFLCPTGLLFELVRRIKAKQGK